MNSAPGEKEPGQPTANIDPVRRFVHRMSSAVLPQSGQKQDVHIVHTLGLGSGRTCAGLGRIAEVCGGAADLLGLEPGSSPTSGTHNHSSEGCAARLADGCLNEGPSSAGRADQGTVDYNEFELVAFWVLSSVPSVLLVITGTVAHRRLSKAWVPRYLIYGILGCLIYAAFAGGLVVQLVPPPYVPGLSEGRGLDLRGVALIVGSWIGGLTGVVAALVTVAGSSIMCRFRVGRA